ncbi:MAG: acylphosphatase [Parafilimonas sp.]
MPDNYRDKYSIFNLKYSIAMLARHIIVKGQVQGVFFRKYTKQKAQQLNIKGWVRNLPDDSVEIIAQGDKKNLQQFIEWCKRGPSNASVTDVIAEEISAESFREFSILK